MIDEFNNKFGGQNSSRNSISKDNLIEDFEKSLVSDANIQFMKRNPSIVTQSTDFTNYLLKKKHSINIFRADRKLLLELAAQKDSRNGNYGLIPSKFAKNDAVTMRASVVSKISTFN